MGTVVVVTVLAAAAYVTAWQSPVRLAAALAFMLVGPGLALSDLIQTRDPWHRLLLAISGSLAVETLIAVALVYAGRFTPERAFAILAIFTVALAVAAVIRERIS
jgi:uncharacterized membrane protein